MRPRLADSQARSIVGLLCIHEFGPGMCNKMPGSKN